MLDIKFKIKNSDLQEIEISGEEAKTLYFELRDHFEELEFNRDQPRNLDLEEAPKFEFNSPEPDIWNLGPTIKNTEDDYV